jgi:tetratricopeptide (TPR) repeat protein
VTQFNESRAVVVDLQKPTTPVCFLAHEAIGHIAMSADGRWVATAADTATDEVKVVKVWEADSGRQVTQLPVTAGRMAFSPDSQWLVTGGTDSFRFWRTGSWEAGVVIARPHELGGGALAFSHDGRVLAVARTARLTQLIDTQTRQEIAQLSTPDQLEIQGFCFSPDDGELAVVNGGGAFQIWDLRTIRKQLAEIGLDWNLPAYPDAPSPEPERLKVEVEPGPHERGDQFASKWRWMEAAAEYSEAIKQTPGEFRLWRERAKCFAELGNYRNAAADFAEASRLRPNDLEVQHYRALALFAMNDTDGFRQLCTQLLQPFDRPDLTGMSAWWVVATCRVAAQPEPNIRLMVRAAEHNAKNHPENWYALSELGGAYYRAGQFDKAIQTTQAAAKLNSDGGNAYDWFFLALAHHQKGHTDEARAWLDKAVRWLELATTQNMIDRKVSTPLTWSNRVILQRLRREAEELIVGKEEKKNEKKGNVD